MNPLNNEQRCTLAQKGDLNARNLLLENNLNFIREIVNELYRGMNLSESDLGIEKEDSNRRTTSDCWMPSRI